jgi:hypothetical protein
MVRAVARSRQLGGGAAVGASERPERERSRRADSNRSGRHRIETLPRSSVDALELEPLSVAEVFAGVLGELGGEALNLTRGGASRAGT